MQGVQCTFEKCSCGCIGVWRGEGRGSGDDVTRLPTELAPSSITILLKNTVDPVYRDPEEILYTFHVKWFYIL